ncbi:MAG: HAD-IIIC family phosphatase [Frankia sp.]
MADEDLFDLHRAGRIAAEYPRVRALLTDLTGADLVRAGQLLSRVPADEVLAAHPGTPAVTVAITGHSTVGPVVPALTAELARHGTVLRPRLSDYDSYVFDLSDPASDLYASAATVTACLLDPTIVFDAVPTPWAPTDVEHALAEKIDLLEQLVGTFERHSSGTLVLNTVPLPRGYAAQLVDLRSRARLGRIWREANARLLGLVDQHRSLAVIDLEPVIGDGVPVREPRLAAYTKTQLSPALLAGYAREAAHLIRATIGKTKKCLVLDLDNTVWGGVLGDDGIEGIEVSETYRGEAFRAFQKAARQLGSQGVLLAAVSKNDAGPVSRVLTEHPEMTLREADFVRVVANWGPKHDNLRTLADDLNLGVDSFVFADDSAYERGLVRHALPDVTVLGLDTDPATHLVALLADGWFDALAVTDEDRGRTELYRRELARRDSRPNFTSIDDYLADLAIEVTLAPAAPGQYDRVSQMTLRTNQFNLTTERLAPAQVQAHAENPDGLVLTIHSRDRFGDNGLVGAVLAHCQGARLVIDNFLLSCRVFSRGIEQSCLSALLSRAAHQGSTEAVAGYRPTAKNGKVADFYPANGFAVLAEEDGSTSFRHDLTSIASRPPHITMTAHFEGAPQ